MSAGRSYDTELAGIARIDREEERRLIEQARQGDEGAREALIVSLLPAARQFAHRFHRGYTWIVYEIGEMDLIGAGNMALVEYFDQALSREKPCAYLLSTAYGAIKLYSQRYQSPIVTPSTPGTLAAIVESLDAPCFRDDDDDENEGSQSTLLAAQAETASSSIDFQPLYEALAGLSAEAQALIAHLFGLADAEPMSLAEYAGGGANTAAYRRVMSRKSQVLSRLREILASHYPQYAGASKHVRHAYNGLALSEEQSARLDLAAQRLQEQGSRITVKALRDAARMHTSYASVYLAKRRAAGST